MDKLLVFASGTKFGGGSGFERLVNASRRGMLHGEIIGVVSNHQYGGVRQRADRLGVPFWYFPRPWDGLGYCQIVSASGAEWFALSGWLKLTSGLDPRRTFNIHPGPLPRFGGKGMYGRRVHEAVLAAYRRGEIEATEVVMHFVTEKFDDGPVFLRVPVRISPGDTAESLAVRVNAVEHLFQPWVTSLVINGFIGWDGRDPDSLFVPEWYRLHKPRVACP